MSIQPESLKGKIKHIAKTKGLSPQAILAMYCFERFLERLSYSDYHYKFIIKGGLLISSIIGLEHRTTTDMDTTIKGMPLHEDTLLQAIKEIIQIDVQDGILFECKGLTHIREDDQYENFRVHLLVHFGKINQPLTIDVTTGDIITPRAIEHQYNCIFHDKPISIMAYPLETVLAEKCETIIRRNIETTRLRDFYDIYTLYSLKKEVINWDVFKAAMLATASHRDSTELIYNTEGILQNLKASKALHSYWDVYLKDNPYVGELRFEDTLLSLEAIIKHLINQ